MTANRRSFREISGGKVAKAKTRSPQPEFLVVTKPACRVAVHRKVLIEEQQLPEHDKRSGGAGVDLTGLSERRVLVRINTRFNLRDLGLQRWRRVSACRDLAREKRRRSEGGKHNNADGEWPHLPKRDLTGYKFGSTSHG
jgi:hypothetical protein